MKPHNLFPSLTKLRKRIAKLQQETDVYILRLNDPQHENSEGFDTDTLHRLLSRERTVRDIWPVFLDEIDKVEKSELKRLGY